MNPNATPQIRLLHRRMCDASEDHWCAQWFIGCEYALWADLTGNIVNGKKPWGISEEDKEELRLLHELAGGWIIWSNELRDNAFLTTGEWLAHLEELDKNLI